MSDKLETLQTVTFCLNPFYLQVCPKFELKLNFPAWPSVSSRFWNVADSQESNSCCKLYYRRAIVPGAELLTRGAEVTYLDRSLWQPVVRQLWLQRFAVPTYLGWLSFNMKLNQG